MEHRSQIVVAFAGTDALSPTNFFTDLKMRMVPFTNCSGCHVHVGFLNAWIKVKHQVVASVESKLAVDPQAEIHVTGHSLGAAIALHTALGLKGQYQFPIAGVHMFGSPRVGDAAFSLHAEAVLERS
jgi:predicted lipase